MPRCRPRLSFAACSGGDFGFTDECGIKMMVSFVSGTS